MSATNLYKPDIRFYSNGRIDITSKVSVALGICPGDVVDLFFDMDSHELYLYVFLSAEQIANHAHRYSNIVKVNKKGSRFFRVQSIAMTSFVLRLTDSDEAWLRVGRQCVKSFNGVQRLVLPIIFRNNLCSNKIFRSL